MTCRTRSFIDEDSRERAPIRPYNARASAKMRIRIIPTKSLGCCALALHRENASVKFTTQAYPDETSLGVAKAVETAMYADSISKICTYFSPRLPLKRECSPDACITNNSNGHSSGKACQSAGQASCQVSIAIEQIVWLVSCLVDCTDTQTRWYQRMWLAYPSL